MTGIEAVPMTAADRAVLLRESCLRLMQMQADRCPRRHHHRLFDGATWTIGVMLWPALLAMRPPGEWPQYDFQPNGIPFDPVEPGRLFGIPVKMGRASELSLVTRGDWEA